MHASVLDARPWRESLVFGGAALVSLFAHIGMAGAAANIEPREAPAPVWVEMAVQIEEQQAPEPEQPEPEPEPESEPEPEPEPDTPDPEPTPEPEVVEYEPEPEPEKKVEPEKKRVLSKGLTNDSFLKGGVDMGARRGNSTATKKVVDNYDEDGFALVPYTSVSTPPKKRYVPGLVIPQAVVDAEIEGRVEAELTIGGDGKVKAVTIVGKLHPAADKACRDALLKSRWKPGSKDGTAVVTRGVPYSCRFAMAVD